MTSIPTIRRYLQEFSFRPLFLEALGWDRLAEPPLHVGIDGEDYVLAAVAQKRGVRVLCCAPNRQGHIPPFTTRLKLSQEITKRSAEHVLVFVDAQEQEQVWFWVRREGSELRPRTHRLRRGQTGDDLAARLSQLAIALSEEDELTVTDVAGKVKTSLDVEKVTKKFFEVFRQYHRSFSAAITGISAGPDREWYASLMLNRLMFVYFIQHKGFLLDDIRYLRTRLRGCSAFYRTFLLRLFHEGLNKRPADRSPEAQRLLGDIPYLNGGLFDVHVLERTYPDIDIPDSAFEGIFEFFDRYQWELDERPTKKGDEINPDVLGYIFEKYINNKQMGAYYTKEDITEYISKQTIIPFVFAKAAREYLGGFVADGPVWMLLRQNPDRYIYPVVSYGVDRPLPPDIAAGIADVRYRAAWNQLAADGYSLPTETWREHVERRQRYQEVRGKLVNGDLASIDDLITYNLNIRQFASDVLASCADAKTLHALFHAIRTVSVLDPTCGSGAFLFAALNILEPLYATAMDRIQGFVDEGWRDAHKGALHDFDAILGEANDRQRHPSRTYFILKSIMLNNLYGVDIMDEAVEICKLRLFLKLVAQAETASQIEPLPDIDFNIRAGNTLVGYATEAQVEHMLSSKMDVFNAKESITASAQATSNTYRAFRHAQARYEDPGAVAQGKLALREQLAGLNAQLNRYLAQEYGIQVRNPAEFDRWLTSHKPFHWFVEFYDIVVDRGGFDVIIGNPPYVAYSKVRKDYTVRGYQTEPCGNLYALTIERSLSLLQPKSYMGMIVPIASISTTGMAELQSLYQSFPTWQSNYAVRPGKLFAGVDMNLTIILLSHEPRPDLVHTTGYYRWFDSEPSNRLVLFDELHYTRKPVLQGMSNPFPKLGPRHEPVILQKMLAYGTKLHHYCVPNGTTLYYHSGGRYWRKAIPEKLSSHYKPITVPERYAPIVGVLLNSQLFYWYWISNSNCMDVVSREVMELPVFRFEHVDVEPFAVLFDKLMHSYFASNTTRQRRGDLIHVDEVNFDVGKAKPIIDDIDRMLAQHYGFSDEELDFIINYDIKYRMGRQREEEPAWAQ
jgi:hypothetical protein